MATGSMIKRGENTWLLQVYAGADWRGKYRPVTKTFHGSEAQAKKELAKFYADVQAGRIKRTGSMTVNELAEEYVKMSAEKQLKRSSLSSVKTAIKIWIGPYLGKKKIQRLKKADIKQWVNAMIDGIDGKQGLKRKTVKNYFFVLSAILEYAVELEYISENPCRGIKLPKKNEIEDEREKCFTPEEVDRMIQALEGLEDDELRFKVAVELGLWGSFRRSEICGFNRNDLNLDTGSITVRRARKIGAGIGVYEDTTKSRTSGRTVVLPKETVGDLRRLIQQQDHQKVQYENFYNESPALIRTDTGEPIYPQTLQRWFKRFCEKNEIRPLGLHALRHTCASIIDEMEGVSHAAAMLRLGHSDLTTTLNTYVHPFSDVDTRIAQKISEKYYAQNDQKIEEEETNGTIHEESPGASR